ncbi:MAG TPA: hypothetical protein VHO72_12290 [Bacteroidales bacterium]|nr:hypothetical protein [Bacteroidales bacterium]
MTPIQEQKLHIFLLFRDDFTKRSLNEDLHPSLKPHFENFLYYLNLILKTRDMMEEVTKTTEDYSFTRNEIIQFTLSLSRKVTAFALLEEMIETQGTFCYTCNELENEDDGKLIAQCKGMLQFIASHLDDLVDYDVDGDTVLAYHNLIDRFKLVIESKTMSNELEQLHAPQVAELFHKTEEIFVNQLTGGTIKC